VLSDIEAELRADVARLRSELARERRAREQRLEIHQLAAETSGQITRLGVAEILAGGTSDIFAAGWVMVAFANDVGMVELVHGPNVPELIRSAWTQIPLDLHAPICEVLRGDAERIALTGRASFEPWPILAGEAEDALLNSFVVEPVGHAESPAAVIAIGWDIEHALNDSERHLLRELADVAAPAFHRATTSESDHHVASTLQRWLLPTSVPTVEGLSIATLFEPGRDELVVGGDWYDVVRTDDGRTAVVVGDVVGHDARAAAEMGQIRHVLASNLVRSSDPSESLALTDHYFHGRSSDTMATALVVVFDQPSGQLEIASAGHLPPVIVEPGTAARTVDCGLGPPIGSGLGDYQSVTRAFSATAVLLGYTDGVVERRDVPIDRCIADFCRDVDHALATASADNVVPALRRFVHRRVESSDRSDDAAAVIVQAQWGTPSP
jgi:hypothetical protein